MLVAVVVAQTDRPCWVAVATPLTTVVALAVSSSVAEMTVAAGPTDLVAPAATPTVVVADTETWGTIPSTLEIKYVLENNFSSVYSTRS